MNKQIVEFFAKMSLDPSYNEKIKTLSTKEMFQEFIHAQGFDFSYEELEAAVAELKKEQAN